MSFPVSASAPQPSRSNMASLVFTCNTCGIEFPSCEAQLYHTCNPGSPRAQETLSEHGPNLLQCLFCSYTSQSLDQNFSHMLHAHGTFIPEQQHLVNPPGLITHLSDQINQFHRCVSCGSNRSSTNGVQSHMIDKGHCMLSFEVDPNLKSFWDLSIGHSESGEDDQYPESVRAQLHSPNCDDSHLASSRVHSHNLSLHLPSGQALGHRSFSRYYRQNLHHKPLHIPQSLTHGTTDSSGSASEALQPMRLHPTTLSKGMAGVPEAKRREVTAVARSAQRSEWKKRSDDAWAMHKEGNLQKYFRVSFAFFRD